MRGWITLEDGGSNRWIYAQQVNPGEYVFLRIDDMVYACGRDANTYFCADVSVVNAADLEQASEAIRSCYGDDPPDDLTELAIAQAMHDYGAKAPCEEFNSPAINKSREDWEYRVPSDSSPTFLRLRATARHFAEANLLDDSKRENHLDSHVVNQLGQTARQYAAGTQGLWDKLREIKDDPNATPEQRLTLRMYQGAKQTLGAGPVPPDLVES